MPRRLLTTAVALFFAACAQDVSVHVRGGDRPPDPDFLTLQTGVEVDRLQLVLRNLKLQSQPTDGGVDTPGAHILGEGPYYMDLPGESLTGGAFTEIVSSVHIGAKGYYEMNIGLSPVTDGDVTLAPAVAPMLGKTFVITGRNQSGVPFTFTSSMTQVLVREQVFRMGMNHNNIDVNIAPNTWFVDADGGVIDPVTATPEQKKLIEANVAASIDAYEDDNMDGEPDPLG
jgi:hypothetical protein